MSKKYVCPVCGYDQLDEPAASHSVCSCCGTHFGYHDIGHTWDELRRNWLLRGAPWFSKAVSPPPGWSPVRQVGRLLEMEDIRVTASSSSSTTEVRRVSLTA